MWSFILRRLTWASSPAGIRVPREGEQNAQCHFCITLVKATVKASSDSRDGKIHSAYCKNIPSHISEEPAHFQPSLQSLPLSSWQNFILRLSWLDFWMFLIVPLQLIPLPVPLPRAKLSLQRVLSFLCVPLTLFLSHTGYSPVYSSISLQIWYLNNQKLMLFTKRAYTMLGTVL